jgi:hypothetical protein
MSYPACIPERLNPVALPVKTMKGQKTVAVSVFALLGFFLLRCCRGAVWFRKSACLFRLQGDKNNVKAFRHTFLFCLNPTHKIVMVALLKFPPSLNVSVLPSYSGGRDWEDSLCGQPRQNDSEPTSQQTSWVCSYLPVIPVMLESLEDHGPSWPWTKSETPSKKQQIGLDVWPTWNSPCLANASPWFKF